MSKIKMLVIPSDHTGCGYFRSLNPHQYIAEHYADDLFKWFAWNNMCGREEANVYQQILDWLPLKNRKS
jgi:hypothetical protein